MKCSSNELDCSTINKSSSLNPTDLDVLVVVSRMEWEQFFTPEQQLRLSNLGVDCRVHFSEEIIDYRALVDLLERVAPEVLVSAWSTPALQEDLLARAPRLKYVCHLCGTVRKLVPVRLIREGLIVSNWGGSISYTIAESALMLILVSLRDFNRDFIVIQNESGWRDSARALRSLSLFGRRVGIHGFGRIARELVALLKPFRCSISSYSKGVPEDIFASHGVQKMVSLDELFRANDVIVELEALTHESAGSVSEKLLRAIPTDGLFVNVARGHLVDQRALERVACEGRLRIALDVFQVEPLPPDSPLRRLPNVVLTPHSSGPTVDALKLCGALAVTNLARYFAGQTPENIVDEEIYARST